MKSLFNGFTFGIGFAIGNRIVDYYHDQVDVCIKNVQDYLLSLKRK